MQLPKLCALAAFFCLSVASLVPAQAVPAAPEKPPAAAPADKVPATPPDANPLTVRIGAGDLLDISVYGVPELSQRVRVSKAGDIYLPLVNYVRVGGLAIEDAQAAVEKQLVSGGYLRNPHVSITVSEAAAGVSLLGEVARPGNYPVYGSRRLLDLISAAGGMTKEAGRVITITHADNPQEAETIVLPEDPTLAVKKNVEIRQGDTVIVSKAGIVYVVGDVVQPSGFIMESGQTLTVLKAIALAHGFTRTAAQNGTKIIRKTPDGLKEISVPLKDIWKAKSADIPLLADDILFVPTSKGKNAASKTLETIVQLGTGITLRRY
jgi:polysaccharide export outer membrane protein